MMVQPADATQIREDMPTMKQASLLAGTIPPLATHLLINLPSERLVGWRHRTPDLTPLLLR